jgi:hypothetical protein
VNLGDAKIGMAFAVRLFDELSGGLHREGIFPRRHDGAIAGPTGLVAATILLDPPTVSFQEW